MDLFNIGSIIYFSLCTAQNLLNSVFKNWLGSQMLCNHFIYYWEILT